MSQTSQSMIQKNDALSEAEVARIQKVIEYTKKGGATQSEVSVSESIGFEVAVRQGQVETVEYQRDRGASITVYIGHQKGSASTTDLSPQALESAARAACDIAQTTQPDPCMGLADPSLMAFDYPELDLHHPWDLNPQQAIQMALECESIALGHDKRIVNSDGAGLSTHNSHYIYGNSHGFIGAFRTSRHSLSCSVVAIDQHHQMQRDYDYTVARDASLLHSPQEVGLKAAQRTVERLDPQRVKTCKVPVLFDASIASQFWGCLISAIKGANIYRQTSFLYDQLNQCIFPENMTIYELPHLKGGMGSAPFDLEGVKTTDRAFVENGVLKSFVLSSYSARQLGMVTTGNAGGVRNLRIKGISLELPALLKKMERGLYVTELMGNGIHLVNGDYSQGAAGFWVEHGEIQYPVAEITIASRLQDMFKQVVALGTDLDTRGNIVSGSVLIEQMTVAGTS